MLAALAALLLAAAPTEPPKKDDPKPAEKADAVKKELKELQALEGKWQFAKFVGKDMEAELDDPEMVVAFDGTKLFIAHGTQKFTGEVTLLDPGADPKRLDMTVEHRKRTITCEAIYKLDGDTLVLAYPPNGDRPRPKNFDKPTDAGVQVITLKRVKR